MVVEQQLDETAAEPEAAVQALTETHEQVVVTETGILSQNMTFLTLTKCLNLTRLYVQRCHNIRTQQSMKLQHIECEVSAYGWFTDTHIDNIYFSHWVVKEVVCFISVGRELGEFENLVGSPSISG